MLRGRRIIFGRTESIIPAPEATHAVRGAIKEALRCKEEGKLTNQTYDEGELAMALAGLPSVAGG